MLGFQDVEVNIDFLAIVNMIKDEMSRSGMGYSLVKSIKNLSEMN
jgi:hypothetical protein